MPPQLSRLRGHFAYCQGCRRCCAPLPPDAGSLSEPVGAVGCARRGVCVDERLNLGAGRTALLRVLVEEVAHRATVAHLPTVKPVVNLGRHVLDLGNQIADVLPISFGLRPRALCGSLGVLGHAALVLSCEAIVCDLLIAAVKIALPRVETTLAGQPVGLALGDVTGALVKISLGFFDLNEIGIELLASCGDLRGVGLVDLSVTRDLL